MKDSFKKYRNGNYDVYISPRTGTKIRDNHRDDMLFEAEFPECADVCITTYCDVGCPFCYVDSTISGKHANADFVKSVLSTFHQWTEVAFGGGSPILHPDLYEILDHARSRNVIANITVHPKHIKEMTGVVSALMDGENPLVKGLGVSCQHYDAEIDGMLDKIGHDRAVIHAIAGITTVEDMEKWEASGRKILILGYKNMGRGKIANSLQDDHIRAGILDLSHHISGLLSGEVKSVVSFDNLALSQLMVKDMMDELEWNMRYMGDDGADGKMTSASMYVDLVNRFFARNSTTARHHPMDGEVDIGRMFAQIRDAE